MEKVVIIGGGFAGAKIARELQNEFAVTLIDSKDYFEFTPGILRTIVSPKHLAKVQRKHEAYLPKASIIVGTAQASPEGRISVNNHAVPYDYLVLAMGSRYNLPFKEQHVVSAARGEHLREHANALAQAKDIVIVGGGLVGVEMAGEIATGTTGKRVIIVHSRDRLMERGTEKASNYAQKYLQKKGVEIIFNERVDQVDKNKVVTDKGRTIRADLIFLCTGIASNAEGFTDWLKNVLTPTKQIMVEDTLLVKGHSRVFAAGDINAIQEEKTAQNAERQADIIISNIRAQKTSKALVSYTSAPRAMDISIGKYAGILNYKGKTITGLLPALLKSAIEWKAMRMFK